MKEREAICFQERSRGAWDVVVCGGGPAGFPAALSAARQGIAVIPDPGAFSDVPYAPHGMFKGQLLAGIPFDPFLMAGYLESVLLDAGVEILYENQAVGVERDGDRISRVFLASKDGISAVEAAAVVDATGDADLAAVSGCGYEYGDDDGEPMAISLMIHVENVNQEELMEYVIGEDDPRFRKKMTVLRAEGIDCYNYEIIIFVKMTREGYFMINGRPLPGIRGEDPASRTEAYITERTKVPGTIELFRRHWPGCRDITLRAVASNLGVRETRRIHAVGRLRVQDVLDGRIPTDTIGFTAYGWDINKGKGDLDPHSFPAFGCFFSKA